MAKPPPSLPKWARRRQWGRLPEAEAEELPEGPGLIEVQATRPLNPDDFVVDEDEPRRVRSATDVLDSLPELEVPPRATAPRTTSLFGDDGDDVEVATGTSAKAGPRTMQFGGPPKPVSRAEPQAPSPEPAPDHEQSAVPEPVFDEHSLPEVFAPGQLIEGTRYRVVRLIGEGGMGAVYEAEHIDIERRCALKVLHSKFGDKAEVVEMFRREARAASRVGSTHIADVFDFAELLDGRVMFAMELLDGPTLLDELEGGPLPMSRVIALLRQICKGLGTAHGKGIVHRDIKPENIVLVVDRGRPDFIKIVDFGIAAIVEAGGSTRAEAAGTPAYLAPELIRGEPFDARADQYSLGCLAYDMITGQPPFTDTDVRRVLGHQLETTPPVPSRRYPEDGVSPVLDDVVMRCLAKDPADRFADLREMEAAICKAQVEAGMTTTYDDLELPDVEAETREMLFARYAALSGESEPPKRRLGWLAAVLVAVVGLGAAGILFALRASTPEPAQDRVAEIAALARGAAAKTHYVYPPANDPTVETAYGYILQLERVQGEDRSAALDRATELRAEFAQAMVEMAEDFWHKEGGKPFAVAYYKQALAFDPSDETANARAALSPDELAELTEKTEQHTFEPDELVITPLPTQLVEAVPQAPSSDSKRRNGKNPRPPAPESPSVAVADPFAAAGESRSESESSEANASPKPSSARKSRGPSAAELVREAKAARGSGDTESAMKLYRKALGKAPNNRAALAALGEMEFDAGNYAKAAELSKRAVSRSPNNARYRIRLGDAYFKLGRYGDAQSQYEKAASLGHPSAEGRLATVERKRGG